MKSENSNQTNSGAPAAAGSNKVIGLILLLALAGIVVAVLMSSSKKNPAAPEQTSSAVATASPASTNQASAAQTAPDAANPFAKVAGRWLRPDGGYVLDISKVGADGKLEAAYYNPRPIRVSKGEASKEGSMIKVMVQLDDTGYPGCVYTLLYDQAKDGMRGTYFQAAMGETYNVEFERLKEEK